MGRNDCLLVEGPNDLHVIAALMQHHNIPEIFKIKNVDGYEKLRNTLDVELLRSDVERLGIVVDADLNISDRWKSLRNVLRSTGYSKVPTRPNTNGTIISHSDLPRVGIWIMPDNRLPGMLENFIEFLVPDGDTLWKQAGECVETIVDSAKFPSQHKIKACVHTWLAWQEEPGKPMGQAITARYLDADAQHAHQFVAWIRRLFVE